MLSVLVPLVAASLGGDRIIAAIATTEVAGSLDFPAEVGILGGNIQELPHHVWGLTVERVDEGLAGHATDEGVDDIGVGDVGELVVLLEEMLDVLPEGLIRPLPIVVDIP